MGAGLLGGRRTEVRDQKSEVRDRKAEIRGQRWEIRNLMTKEIDSFRNTSKKPGYLLSEGS